MRAPEADPKPAASPPESGASAGPRSDRVAIVVGAGASLATIAATIACVGPLIAILLGVGGFGWLSQYIYLRVPASITTALMLAFGFYWVYRTKTIRGGDLGCGNGLLLIIKDGLAKIAPGEVIELQSRDPTVREDLPAWCRMVGHTLVETRDRPNKTVSYFIRKASGATGDELAATEKLKRTDWKSKPTSKKVAIVILWVTTVFAVGMNLFEYVIFQHL